MAYELDLLVGSSVHPVFHVSQLKVVISPQTLVSPTLPNLNQGIQALVRGILRSLEHTRFGAANGAPDTVWCPGYSTSRTGRSRVFSEPFN
jgi:hypothetical protein